MIQSSTMNQMGNAHNSNQGAAKRVLCICSAGMLRSATAANVLHAKYGFNTRSAGIADYALIPVSEVLLEWANQIVCMDEEHADLLIHGVSKKMDAEAVEELKKDIIVLGIPDQFRFMDPELQTMILERYERCTNPQPTAS